MISLQRRQCCFFLRIKNSEGYENRGFGCCPGMKLQHLLFMFILELDGLVVVQSLPSLRSNYIYGCHNLSSVVNVSWHAIIAACTHGLPSSNKDALIPEFIHSP